jgi:hypothetical protein
MSPTNSNGQSSKLTKSFQKLHAWLFKRKLLISKTFLPPVEKTLSLPANGSKWSDRVGVTLKLKMTVKLNAAVCEPTPSVILNSVNGSKDSVILANKCTKNVRRKTPGEFCG